MEGTRARDDLGRFLELARDFHAAAERGDTAAQERILAQRRRLVPSLEESPAPAGPVERQERERILRAILELDRDSEAILERAREELSGELLSLDSGRRGLAGYGGGTGSAGKWIDERR